MDERTVGPASADIAVIGMACRFPEAPDAVSFWANLADGKGSVREIPSERWDWREFWGDPETQENKCNSRWAGFVDGVDAFDARFFKASRRDAELWDPQQRIMLELAWTCLEDAGLRPSSLSGSKVGVYVGSAVLDYKELLEEEGLIEAQYAAAVSHSVIASRISHRFNFTGPSVPMDTACSSSLYAIHLAIQSLRRGECRMALAGGVNVLLTPRRFISFSKMGILSPTGACRSFDDAADGTVRGEGAGVVLLKPLSEAIEDGDPIHGVIKGSAINHSGKTHTLSYPNPIAQADVIREAWRDARVAPESISYVEAHGTGTPKGDPLEFDGLKRAFEGAKGARCAISSVKTNIGHLESAAGIAGVIKVLMSMKHRRLAPLRGFRTLNHRISLEGTPFHFVQRLEEWQPPGGDGAPARLRAGVSSFGFAGTNAHVVLEEAPEPSRDEGWLEKAPSALVCLSAKTESALRRAATDLERWIESHRDEASLEALSAALLGTKERFPVRLAVIAADVQDLERALGAFGRGAKVEHSWHGSAGEDEESPLLREVGERLLEELRAGQGLEAAAYREKLSLLGELYVKGVELDWAALFGGVTPRDLRLPTYPFDQERYWLPSRDGAGQSSAASQRLHPLVHENVSDLGAQRFVSVFRGTESFLADHLVRGEKVLPASAYLEMARAAVVRSIPGAEGATVRLRDVVFLRPLRVGDAARRVEISVSPGGDGLVEFRIASTGDGDGLGAIEHCEGRATVGAAGGAERIDLEATQAACTRRTLDQDACYRTLRQLGFEHGKSHRGIESALFGDQELLARLTPAPELCEAVIGCGLPPGPFDSALQAIPVLMAEDGAFDATLERLPVPFAVEEMEIRREWPTQSWVRVRACAAAEDERRFDLDLCDERGEVFVRLNGFAVRWVGEAPASLPVATGELFAVRSWEESAIPPESESESRVLAAAQRLVLLCEPEAGVAEHVASRLEGARCVALPAEGDGVASRFVNAAAVALEEVRNLLRTMPPNGALVQIVYGAGGGQRLYGALAGLLKSASQEHPGLVGQVIELEEMGEGERILATLLECARSPGEREVRYGRGGRWVARWQELESLPESQWPWKDGGVYLLSGGVGALGLVMAEQIARSTNGATVHLFGRSVLPEATARRLEAQEALGCTLRYSRVDVAQREAVTALVERIRTEHGRLDGVLHAAGVLRDDFILRKEKEAFEAVLSAKVRGAVNLDEATKDLPLDFFILFSSVAGVVGNVGQADYATANAFLDAYAALREERRAAGERSGLSLSIDWPLWREGGMRVDVEMEQVLWERLAMSAIETREGLRAFRMALGCGAPHVLYVEGDLARLRQRFLEAPRVVLDAQVPSADARGAALEVDAAVESSQLREQALELVKRELSVVLKVAPARMDPDTSMENHGIDSIAVTQLTRQLERTFGPLPTTLFFEHRNIRELADALLETHGTKVREALARSGAGDASPSRPVEPNVPRRANVSARRFMDLDPAPAPEGAERPAVGPNPIAIIGVAGRYPGARNTREFWSNLRDGQDCVTEVPPNRWDHRRYFDEEKGRPGKTYSRWGGFIDGVDEFDPLFFNISPREAEIMDPQERLFLQCVHETLEDAGYTRESLRPSSGGSSSVGVFVGVMWEEYPLWAAQEQARGRNVTVTGSPASIANRVSYVYDFTGPSMAVDTLCSSSLTAIHLACQSLGRGECAAAVAGGVNVSIHPNKYLALAAGGYVSSKGRCESFGEGGDGYVPGEGVGAVLLKPLARAVADGDQVYGVIKGTAVNHGGKTNGFTVPSPRAQSAVIGAALKAAGVSPRAVSYIEAHGTGTSLGDPIEIAGLTKAFEAAGVVEPGVCAIGSAKSNIGHCESAAGVAGLTKVLLQLKHRELVPSLHSERLNPGIRLDRTPFRVQQTLAPWERPSFAVAGEMQVHPRLAGISSFGAGGSNAHLIVEEYDGADGVAAASAEAGPVIVVLSARDEERLRASARQLLGVLREGELGDGQLVDLAYTLQVGREAMEERLGLIVASVGELEERLQHFLDGQRDVEGVFRGRASGAARTVAGLAADEDMARTLEAWIAKRKYAKLLSLWVEGLPLDWKDLHENRRRRRLSLPTYCFARERYWIPKLEPEAMSRLVESETHPLLHENTSDFSAQRFGSAFSGDEFFLRDHLVDGRKVLPGAAQLEMARAAVEVASSCLGTGDVVRLEEIVWPTPAVVDGEPLRVSIELFVEEDGGISFEIRGESKSSDNGALYSRGAAALGPPPALELLDIDVLRARCAGDELGGAECYAAFEQAGIVFGPAHRGVEHIYLGRSEALAKLSLPAAAQDGGRWGLHPAMLDSALQAAIALVPSDRSFAGPSSRPEQVASTSRGSAGGVAAQEYLTLPSAGVARDWSRPWRGGGEDRVVLLPASLSALEIHRPLEGSMWAHVRSAEAGAGEDGARAFDVDLCNEEGKLCARVLGLELRPAVRAEADKDEMQAMLLAPVWEAAVVQPSTDLLTAEPEGRTLLVRSNFADTVSSLPSAVLLEAGDEETAESLEAKVRALGAVRRVVWVAPEVPPSAHSGEALLRQQDGGVLHLFRLIKALLGAGYGSEPLDWTVVTTRCIPVDPTDVVEPAHAGVHGLAGAMAKDFPSWIVRLVDVDREISEEELAGVRVEPDGRAWALRGADWYRRRLVPVDRAAPGRSPFRRGAVYVVVGGAGGVGEVWSEHVVRSHQAQVVWIGRRAPDAAIQKKIDRLAALGPAPRYVQADATEPDSLRAALRVIKEAFSQVHGLVHSAIVLRDRSLANMDEETFRSAYAAKADTSVHMAAVFGEEPLDFVAFFSSTLGLVPSAGQSNYAAGCAFEDAFARRLGQEWPCPVKVMNWGYWGEHGVVAGEAYRRRMAQLGIGSIEPTEAMAAVDSLLASPLPQAAFIKTTDWGRLESTAVDEALAMYREEIPAVLPELQLEPPSMAADVVAAAEDQEQEERELLEDLLAAQLEQSGVDWRAGADPEACWPDLCHRWLEESCAILAASEAKRELRSVDAWERFELAMESWRCDPNRRARAELLEISLGALPDILSGRRSATEVIFPGASFALVEGIYRGNDVADFFNATAADLVAAYLEARTRIDPSASIRILEVGAGTGAGSVAILAKLDGYSSHVAEYCFTDVSKAFTLRAQEANEERRRFIRAEVFDVNLPVAEQGLESGRYDLAIAVNVLHATEDVRRSLRNVKAAMKTNGVLVINELSQKSLFGHLTFGLLEGWWLHRDSALRISGSPALSPMSWQRVLEQEGFHPVLFPVEAAHRAGQQVVAAQSDGVVRQRVCQRADPRREQRTADARRDQGDTSGAPPRATQDGVEALPPEATADEGLRARGRDYLRRAVGEVLKMDAARIDSSEPLGRYGIDSILIARLTGALRHAFGEVKSTLLFEHQTIDAVVEELVRTRREALAALPAHEAPPKEESGEGAPQTSEKRIRRLGRRRELGPADSSVAQERLRAVAVVGLAGRYPSANDVREYWRNLRAGRNCISEVPSQRWDWRDYFGEERGSWGTIYTKWGGFIEDIARFDPAFFRLSPREAGQMDPQERLFLEVAYGTIEDAGYTPSSLSQSKHVGVFVGVMNAHYGHGPAHWSIANRVSYTFDFQGPSLAVDTACSSSLTAIHLALDSLEAGTSECAIAGGVNIIVDPVHPMRLAAASMLSSGNACRAFGAGADGMVDGEAVGAVLLKPLARAIADGDHIYGVIRGSMLNAGGRTNGYTVPNPSAQQRAITEALRRAGVSPRMVSYVEAHGTGTELGDPIELAGLTHAFEEATDEKQFCALGSAKSNIGHCESAAGIAGLTKVLLQMRHRELVPTLHASTPNPKTDFARTPFRLQQALGPWTRPRISVAGVNQEVPRVAGVSSFGAGGANAHLVVEEQTVDRTLEPTEAGGPVLVVLSARTERDLNEKARQLAKVIEDGEIEDEEIADVAFTLQVGREAMEERVGFIVSTLGELSEALQAFARGEQPAAACRRGRAAPGQGAQASIPPEAVRRDDPRAAEQLEEVLAAWVAGSSVDWSRISEGQKRRRVSLPSYPFAGERYWAPVRRERTSPRTRDLPLARAAPSAPPANAPAAARNREEEPRTVRLTEPERAGATEVSAQPSEAEGGGRPKVRLRPLATPPAESSRRPPPKAVDPGATREALPEPLEAQSAPVGFGTLPERATASPAETALDRVPSRSASWDQQPADGSSVERAPAPLAIQPRVSLREELVTSLAKALYMRPDDVELDKKFADMGLDSIIGVEWIKALNKKLGTSLKATIVYDHPDIRSFERFLRGQLNQTQSPRQPEVDPPRPAPSLRELLLQVQRGEVSVEEASRLHSLLERTGTGPYQREES